jgi:hypothetical protein
MSLYDVASLSNTPSLSTAGLNVVINMSNLLRLICSWSASQVPRPRAIFLGTIL